MYIWQWKYLVEKMTLAGRDRSPKMESSYFLFGPKCGET